MAWKEEGFQAERLNLQMSLVVSVVCGKAWCGKTHSLTKSQAALFPSKRGVRCSSRIIPPQILLIIPVKADARNAVLNPLITHLPRL